MLSPATSFREGTLVVFALTLISTVPTILAKPFGPDKLKEDHSFKIHIDGISNQQQVDGSYNLDLVRQDGTRQKITSNGPTVQGTYEYLDPQGQKRAVTYEASREGGFRILNPDDAEGLREIPDRPMEAFRGGRLRVTESHASTLEFHRRTVEKAWRDQELHSVGATALKEKFGGGLINASLHREKDPKSNAVHSVFRKEFRDSSGRLRGFQQAHSIVHAINASALVNGSGGPMAGLPIPLPLPGGGGGQGLSDAGVGLGVGAAPGGAGSPAGMPFGGLNLAHVVDKIREFHQSLFGAGGGGGVNGTMMMGDVGGGVPMLPFMGPPPAAMGGPEMGVDPARMRVPESHPPPI